MGPRTKIAVAASVASLGLFFVPEYRKWSERNRVADLGLAVTGVLGFWWALKADEAERLSKLAELTRTNG